MTDPLHGLRPAVPRLTIDPWLVVVAVAVLTGLLATAAALELLLR
ncbi:MAG: hypothetical protein ACOYNI_09170 [Acidimicrobiia bacterium]